MDILTENKGKKTEVPFFFPIILIILIILTIVSYKTAFRVEWLDLEMFNLKGHYNKDVIFYFHADNCGYCKKMENSTFSDRNVANKLKKDYLAVKVDLNKEEEIIIKGKTYKISDLFTEKGIKGIPAVIIYEYKLKTGNGKFYYHFSGYRNSFEFLDELKEARKIKRGL